MLFDSSKNKCIFQILKILSLNKSTYSELFRKTKVSHVTLQTALKEMAESEILYKHDNIHFKKEYSITKKGIKFLELLKEVKKF